MALQSCQCQFQLITIWSVDGTKVLRPRATGDYARAFHENVHSEINLKTVSVKK